MYSEYISPSDLDRLLFGSEDTDSRKNFTNLAESAERNKIEYNFVREFYLKGLNNFLQVDLNTTIETLLLVERCGTEVDSRPMLL